MSERVIESSSTSGDQSEETFVIRSFRAEDREQVAALHREGVAASLCCDCTMDIQNIEQTYFGRKHGHFWVAECDGKLIGTLALLLEEEEVAHLHCLRISNEWSDPHGVRRRLVQAAATHARDHGSLKLVLHANLNETRAAAFLHRLGFEFSRHREVDGQPALEFYLNLYQRPELGEKGGDIKEGIPT